MAHETEPGRIAERQREKEVIKRRLASLAAESEPVRRFIEENVAAFNGRPGDPRSFDLLDGLMERQCYRLAYWRVAPDEINYRRFFDVNDLAALSMERAGGLRGRPPPGPAAGRRGEGRRPADRPPRRPV